MRAKLETRKKELEEEGKKLSEEHKALVQSRKSLDQKISQLKVRALQLESSYKEICDLLEEPKEASSDLQSNKSKNGAKTKAQKPKSK